MSFVTENTPEEAIEWLERYGLHDDGSAESDALMEPAHRKLFTQYVEHMLHSPESTRQTRISCAHTWLQWLEDRGVIADKAEQEHMFHYVDGMLANDLAHASIGSRVDTVVLMYEWGYRRGYFDENPYRGFELESEYSSEGINRGFPKQVRVLREKDPEAEPIISISKEQVEKLIEHSGTPRARNQLCNRLLWQTGLRTSELASVLIENIDEEERSITVRSAKVPIDDEEHPPYRTVYYQENLEYAMWEWLHGGARESLYSGDEELDENKGHLLLTRQNSKMRPSHISRTVKESAIRAGINEVLYIDAAGKRRWMVTGHTIRHSFATFCANGDGGTQEPMPLHTLKYLLSHRSMDTTLKYLWPDGNVRQKHAQRYGPR
ncbi:tyrosine-type recombinase/integrase [Halobacteriaceae archaeon GCM10025711]